MFSDLRLVCIKRTILVKQTKNSTSCLESNYRKTLHLSRNHTVYTLITCAQVKVYCPLRITEVISWLTVDNARSWRMVLPLLRCWCSAPQTLWRHFCLFPQISLFAQLIHANAIIWNKVLKGYSSGNIFSNYL